MTMFAHLSQPEKDELLMSWTYQYNQGEITSAEFKAKLGQLGLNATQIEDAFIEADKFT